MFNKERQMKTVNQEEFFAFIKANAASDPMPSKELPEVTLWKTQKGAGRVVAKSYPGWRNVGEPQRYEIEE
jgi:hypothetical protein